VSAALEVPDLLHGVAKDVRRRAAVAVRSFVAGAPWDEAIAGGPATPVASIPGLLVLNGPSPLLGGDPHFHVFLPLMLVLHGVRDGKIPEAKRDEAVTASLATPWGLLGVIAPVNQLVVYPAARHRPVAAAAASFWGVLDGVGPRYTVGLREGARLWDVVTNLQYVLARLGVPEKRLRAPLPGGDLRAIVPAGG